MPDERTFGGVIKVTADLHDVEAALARIKAQIADLNTATANIKTPQVKAGQQADPLADLAKASKSSFERIEQEYDRGISSLERSRSKVTRALRGGTETIDWSDQSAIEKAFGTSPARISASQDKVESAVRQRISRMERLESEIAASQRRATESIQKVSTGEAGGVTNWQDPIQIAAAARGKRAVDIERESSLEQRKILQDAVSQRQAILSESDRQQRELLRSSISQKSEAQKAESVRQRDINTQQKQLLSEEISSRGRGVAQGGAYDAMAKDLARVSQVQQQATQQVKNAEEAHNRLGRSVQTSNERFSRHIQNVAMGMLEWQAMNTVMNAAGTAFNSVIDGTMRLDAATAKLSVTLGTTKAIAREYAESMVQQGVQYGQAPAESLALAGYVTRVRKAPQEQQELYQAASRISLVTGEDALKLMDSLNVTARNTGMSFEQLENLAVATFENPGTSAQTALDIMREIGPIAKQAGVDMVQAFSVVAQTADLTGGNVSEAANAFTRLTMLATNPNVEQQRYLNEQMGISYMGEGGKRRDPNEIIREFTQKATQTDISKVWGGRPEVTQGLMPLLDVYKKTQEGENTILEALNNSASAMDAYKATTDTTEMAVRQLGAAASAMASTIIEDTGVIKTSAQGMTTTIQMLPSLLKGDISGVLKSLGYDEGTIAKFKQYQEQQPKGLLERVGEVGLGKLQYGEQREAEAAKQMAQDKAMELSEREREIQAERTQIATAGAQQAEAQPRQFGASRVPSPYEIYMPYQDATGKWQEPKAQLPEKTIDVTGRSRASIELALKDTERMKNEDIESFRKMYKAMGFDDDMIAQLIAEKEKTYKQSLAFVEAGGQKMPVTGTQAYFLEQSLRQQDKLASSLSTRAEDFTQYSDEDFRRAKALLPQWVDQSQQMWRQELKFQGVSGADAERAIQTRMTQINETQLPAMRGNQMTMLTGAAAVFLPQILPTLSRTSGLEDRLKDLRASLEDLNDTEKKRAQLEGQWNIPTGAKLLVPLTSESQKLIKEHGGETEDEAKNRRREQILKEIAETEQKLAAEKAKDASILAMFAGQQTASDKSMSSLFNLGTAADTGKTSLDAFSQALGMAATGGVAKTSQPAQAPAEPDAISIAAGLARTGGVPKNYQTFMPLVANQAAAPQTIQSNITIQPITVTVQMNQAAVGQAITPVIQEQMSARLTEFAIGTPMITQ